MSFRVSGKNIEIGEALRERISARVLEALEKYFDGGFSGHVTVGKEAFGFHTECVVHLDSGIVLRADSMAADAYLSADQAARQAGEAAAPLSPPAEGLSRRRPRQRPRAGRRSGDRRAELRHRGAASTTSEDEVSAFNPVIIAESTTALRRLSVSEAVTELDMTGVAVMVFRHASHGRINLVYRRADGNVGWIDPPAMPAQGG